MTPTNEMALARLTSDKTVRDVFHPSELKYLINLVTDDVNRSYGVFK